MSERVSSAGARATTGIEADCQTEGAFLEPQSFRVVLTTAQEEVWLWGRASNCHSAGTRSGGQQIVAIPVHPVVGIGDVSFTSNDKELSDSLRDGLAIAILAWLLDHFMIVLIVTLLAGLRTTLRTRQLWP